MRKILFDTDVLVEHLRDNPRVTDQIQELHEANNHLSYCPISEAEIYQGLRSHERSKTELLLNGFACLEISREIGRRAGEYLRKYSRSHGLELPDAIIAACAVIHRFELCTFNWKHYPMSEVERHRMER